MPDQPKYKAMWIFALFDLPTTTKNERKDATFFRDFLYSEGFIRIQYSVYACFCDNSRQAETHITHIRKSLPSAGEVRLVSITDKQFSDMFIFVKGRKKRSESAPEQLLLF